MTQIEIEAHPTKRCITMRPVPDVVIQGIIQKSGIYMCGTSERHGPSGELFELLFDSPKVVPVNLRRLAETLVENGAEFSLIESPQKAKT